jgi:hypothetical protein
MGDAALSLLIALLNQAGAISAALRTARAEGRELNAADWQAILDRDDLAAAQQVAAIARAQAEGR